MKEKRVGTRLRLRLGLRLRLRLRLMLQEGEVSSAITTQASQKAL